MRRQRVYLRTISPTGHATIQACLRKFEYSYLKRYRPVSASKGAPAFGHAAHQCLAAYYLAVKAKFDREDWIAKALEALDAIEGLDAFDHARLEAMLLGYHLVNADWVATLEIVSVESEHFAPLLKPNGKRNRKWRLHGIFDVLVRLPDGRLAVVEHKTTGESNATEPGSTYRQKLTINGQVAHYFELIGADVVVYDILSKPKLRPLQSGTHRAYDETPAEYLKRCCDDIGAHPEKYFATVELVRLPGEREAYLADVNANLKIVDTAAKLEHFPRNPNSCFAYGRPCDFWPVCSGTATLEDPARYMKREEQ